MVHTFHYYKLYLFVKMFSLYILKTKVSHECSLHLFVDLYKN
jgi:hypothetical protein